MRIVSKFKDYYDNALAYGIDTSRVFVRKEEVKQVFIKDLVQDHLGRHYDFDFGIGLQNSDETITWVHVIIVGFCGDFYLGCQFQTCINDQVLEEKVLYDLAEIEEAIWAVAAKYGSVKESVQNKIKRLKDEIEKLDRFLKMKPMADWFHLYQSPILLFPATLLYTKEELEPYLEQNIDYFINQFIIINPTLKNVDFYRVKNSFECFQEISQFLYGVLTNNEDIGDTLDDKGKVQSHGFDPKYGFRKRPME